MTDGARKRSGTSGSAGDAAGEKDSGGGVALKKEIGLVSACGIIVGELLLPGLSLSWIRTVFVFVARSRANS